jgi:hypothetical protein
LQARAKIAQGLLGKMVQDETTDTGIRLNIWQGLKKISAEPLDAAREVCRTRDQVEASQKSQKDQALIIDI